MNNNFRQVLVGVILNGLGHYLHQGSVWCVPVGARGPCGFGMGEPVGCVQSRGLSARASPSEVYPAGKRQ